MERAENFPVAAARGKFAAAAGNSGNGCRRQFQRWSEAVVLLGARSASKMSGVGDGRSNGVSRR